MSYLVLARKYRPLTFSDMVGQGGVATTLQNAIKQDRVAHAYLFTGSRGTGKTSMARILAKALNCPDSKGGEPCNKCDTCSSISAGSDVDVIEIDGASNNKVEEARTLREGVRYVPQRSKNKIYIIDEVHMLTVPAFNALLKTIEEPPPHVKFILATTEPQKIPETIHSRCQRFDFRRLSPADIAARLKQVAKEEGIKTEPGLIETVARSTRGGMRDAISLLDQLWSFSTGKIKVEDLNEILGRSGTAAIAGLFDALGSGDGPKALQLVASAMELGRDIAVFIDEAVDFARTTLVLKICGEKSPLLEGFETDVEFYRAAAGKWTEEKLLYAIELFSSVRNRIRWVSDKRTPLEVAVLKLAKLDDMAPIGELIARLEHIEPGASPAGARPAAQTGFQDAKSAGAPAARPAGRAAEIPRSGGEDVKKNGEMNGRSASRNAVREHPFVKKLATDFDGFIVEE